MENVSLMESPEGTDVVTSGGHGEKKERMKEQAIAALLDQPSIAKAARTLGISENTLAAWLKDPDFAREYQSARETSLSHAIDRLQGATSKAVETLLEMMGDDTVPAASRLSAAKVVLDMHFKAVEAQRMEERVTKVEDFIRREVIWT